MARYNTSSATTSINGSTTISSPYQGAFTELTGTAPYTVTLPSPVLYPGQSQTFYNATSGTITLNTPSGMFSGLGGSGTSNQTVPVNTVVSITSDGTNYVVLSEDGSVLYSTDATITGNLTVSGATSTTSITTQNISIAPTSTGNINNMNIGVTNRGNGYFATLSANGSTTLTANVASSSTSTGTLVVTGGLGVSGAINSASVTANTLTGTIQTAAQTNITSVGDLTAPSLIVDSNTIYVDKTNHRLGVGTTGPIKKLDVRGTLNVGGGSEGLWLGNIGDNTAYDNVTLNYTGYNGGAPFVVLQPRTTPGSGILTTFLQLKNSNGSDGTANNRLGLIVDSTIIGGANNTTNVGYGSSIYAYKDTSNVSTGAQESNSAGIFGKANATGDVSVFIGADQGTTKYGWIGAVNRGTGYLPLVLQPAGGSVFINTTTDPNISDASGNVKLVINGDQHFTRQSAKIYFGDVTSSVPLSIGEGEQGSSGADADRMSIYSRNRFTVYGYKYGDSTQSAEWSRQTSAGLALTTEWYTTYTRSYATPDGGTQTVRFCEDCLGRWIVVGKFAADARVSVTGTWGSVRGLSTSTSQSDATSFSADFGSAYPTEVRVMGSTNFDYWKENRTIDFVYRVPSGRTWGTFFNSGSANGDSMMTVTARYGFKVNGGYDGFGRWNNPSLTDIGMSDGTYTNPSTAYSTPTANAFNWNTTQDAKLSIIHTGAYSGQDVNTTSAFGVDDSATGFFDVFPNVQSNMGGNNQFSSAVWIMIKLN